jgi:hypothetical protein
MTDPIDYDVENGDNALGYFVMGNEEIVAELTNVTVYTSSYATPEPSTWAMMLIGLAGLGYVGYRHRQKLAGAASV